MHIARFNSSLLIISLIISTLLSGCHLPSPPVETPTNVSSVVTEFPEINTWQRVYGDGLDNSGSDLLQTNDGGYLIAGGIQSGEESFQVGGVLLMKTNHQGLVAWQHIYGGEAYDAGWTLSALPDGDLVIGGETTSFGEGGRDAYIIRVDAMGKEQWSRAVGTTLDEMITHIIMLENGHLLLIGNQVDPNNFIIDPGTAGYGGFAGKSDPYLVCISPEGSIQWQDTLLSDRNTLASEGVKTQDGSVYIAANILNFPDDLDEFKLIKLDEEGHFLWERVYPEKGMKGYAIRELSSGNLLIVGVFNEGEGLRADILVMLLDLEGEIIWKKPIGQPYEYDFGYDMVELPGGELVILGMNTASLYTGNDNLVLAALDPQGNLIRDYEINSLNRTKGSSFILADDGALVITGGLISDMNIFNMFLMKFDPGVLFSEE